MMHDPGGKVRTKPQDFVTYYMAHMSPCERYRYSLWRSWAGPPNDGYMACPYAMWIGANPSTADSESNDPTVTREINFTKQWGIPGYLKFNVMDYRATYPNDLLGEGVVPNSQHNHRTIIMAADKAERIIVCYGALHPKLEHYAVELVAALELRGYELWCFGRTKNGSPRHPLYLPGTAALERFR